MTSPHGADQPIGWMAAPGWAETLQLMKEYQEVEDRPAADRVLDPTRIFRMIASPSPTAQRAWSIEALAPRPGDRATS